MSTVLAKAVPGVFLIASTFIKENIRQIVHLYSIYCEKLYSSQTSWKGKKTHVGHGNEFVPILTRRLSVTMTKNQLFFFFGFQVAQGLSLNLKAPLHFH